MLLLTAASAAGAQTTQTRATTAIEAHSAHRRRLALYILGGGGLALSWAANAVAGAFAGGHVTSETHGGVAFPDTWEPGWDAFRGVAFVPVLGPWIQLALFPDGGLTTGWLAWLIADGAIQALGLTLFVWAASLDVPVMPTVSPDGAGLVVSDTF